MASLAVERAAVTDRIRRVLTRRDLIGDWTPGLRAEYRALGEQEQRLVERIGEITDGFSSGVGTRSRSEPA